MDQTWQAVIVALITASLTFFVSRRKVAVDESTLILAKWKELVESHEGSIKALREEFDQYRKTSISEIDSLRARLERSEKRIVELETENAGLRRQFLQSSDSTVIQLGKKKDVGDA